MNKVIGGVVMLVLGWWIIGKGGDPKLVGINIGNVGAFLLFFGLIALIWGAFSSSKKGGDSK